MNVKNTLPLIAMLLMVFGSACEKHNKNTADSSVQIPNSKNGTAEVSFIKGYPNPLGPAGADPGVILDNGTYYYYCTSGNSTGAMPIKWSSDLINWTDNGARVFPLGQLPAWVNGGNYWAPEVHLINGKYVCYYSAKGADGWFKIGVATAPSPTGPFTDKGSPLVSRSTYSLIDPTFFRDPATGKNYVLWKNNTNALDPPQQTHLVIQEVTQDGLSLLGSSTNILGNTLAWEELVVEAPTLVYRNGYYYLFYSGNNYGTDKYAVGVARATTITGAYTKKGAPILTSDSQFDGPGGQCIITNSPLSPYLMFYHARLRSEAPSTTRYLMMDKVNWGADNWPIISRDYIVDNAGSGFSASSNWVIGTAGADKYKTSYHYRQTLSGSPDRASFTANTSGIGDYDIYAWWSVGTAGNRTPEAHYFIPGGQEVIVDQRINGGKWNYLGTVRFTVPGDHTVQLAAGGPAGYAVIGDAIMMSGPK